MATQIVLLIVFLGLSAFFSGSETAYTSLTRMQVKEMEARWPARAAVVSQLLDRPDRLLTTVLIGNNLANIAASALASDLTIRLFGSGALGYMTGILTLIVLIFGEVTPKQLAITHNEVVTAYTARVISMLSILFAPLIWLVGSISQFMTRLAGEGARKGPTLEGLLYMVNHAANLGVIEGFRSRMVRGVFRLSDANVHAIMTHRTEVFSLSERRTVRSVLSEIAEEGYSRIPVYQDHSENIVGVVLVRDLLTAVAEGRGDEELRTVMVPPLFVPEHRRVTELFLRFKREKLNLAIVLDEYGGLAGIVTVEDVIEEIMGEIYDENEDRDREKIRPLTAEAFEIQADLPIHVFNDYFDVDLPQRNLTQSIGGHIVEMIGHIPHKGEVVRSPAGEFVAEHVSHTRILSVRFVPARRAQS